MTLTTYDYCGGGASRVVTGRYSYSVPGAFVIGPRRSDGDRTEPNPFSFTFATADQAAPGAVSLASSLVATTSGSDLVGNPRNPRLLLTYWRFAYSKGTLTGNLVDTHVREAMAYNLLNMPRSLVNCRPELGSLASPGPIAVNSTLRGRLTASGADLTLTATTTDGMAAFTLRFRG